MATTSIHKQAEKHSPGPLVVRYEVYRALPLINRAVLKMMESEGDAVILPADENVGSAGKTPAPGEHTMAKSGTSGRKSASGKCSL